MPLTLLLAVGARADVSLPAPAPAPERSCTRAEWLSLKHALARHCARRSGSACEVVRKDLAAGGWCDGEDDPPGCAGDFYVRHGDDRCRITGTGRAGALQIRVTPDCWWWDVLARRAGAGWKILGVAWGDRCD